MTKDDAAKAWVEAHKNAQSRFAIVEAGLLSEPARQQFLKSDPSRRPLMLQSEFAELRNYGPWLVDVSDMEFEAFLAHEYFTGCTAMAIWIRTDCPADKLAAHLSDALLAKNEAGEVLMIRSYAPEVLPMLHARDDLSWHAWLFGPLQEWWVPTADDEWQCFKGLNLEQPGKYQPIFLDARLWKDMEVDPLPYNLTTELEKDAPEVFTSSCHGDRLNQVKQALDAGRAEGLSDPEDVSLFASLQLMDPEFPANWPMWNKAKERAVGEKLPLGVVMRELSE
ncbi:DUF4123 domain-containing protein [Pseudomonas sp. GW456-12-1-14-TSB6]|uniref:DUF4123 domain-containing protein n=1 Tax=Pseudomonas sp. GW456-12-1-14-TSB6 TaxID=2751350 RepID=UPI000CD22F38|nr:DUF4123 domain-containing protein [Pseudomonas sp. GW456-12-1-14-TSB6]POA37161.1 hypothetical protein C1891_13045 [Pseudomonas sp. GW456-12-1-14-TSB6]